MRVHWIPAVLVVAIMSWPLTVSADRLACQARVTYDQGLPPIDVTFQTLVAGASGQYEFFWDFGDGATSTAQNPNHTYTQSDFFYATVRVTDMVTDEVCRDSVLVQVGVIADPLCSASASTRWGDAPLGVNLSAFPIFGCGPPPYSWSWRFGDGQVSSEQSPQHVYTVGGTYWAVATLHSASSSCDCYPTLRITALPDVTGIIPAGGDGSLRIEPARPNPFGVMTTLTFDLPQSGHTRLVILDVSGRLVAELVNEFQPVGRTTTVWQGRTTTGRRAPPGLYVARLEHGGVVRMTRLVRVR